ncbi:MAG: PRC-barrel domain-containing protein [Clostridia bacterium]|nr:PRC-barrel domain-containing protein [Clostridia bacterium]
MERYSEVVGLPVICVNDGRKIGIVNEVIFCPRTKEVKAFLLERKGCQISSKVVLLKDVLNLGKDALVVSDCSCAVSVKKAKKIDDLNGKGEIKGLKIYTKSGEDLGIVKDVLFDYKTGTIEGVEISDGLLYDIVQGRNILPLFGKVEFGEDNILVDKEAVDEMISTGGGLKKKLLGE